MQYMPVQTNPSLHPREPDCDEHEPESQSANGCESGSQPEPDPEAEPWSDPPL